MGLRMLLLNLLDFILWQIWKFFGLRASPMHPYDITLWPIVRPFSRNKSLWYHWKPITVSGPTIRVTGDPKASGTREHWDTVVLLKSKKGEDFQVAFKSEKWKIEQYCTIVIPGDLYAVLFIGPDDVEFAGLNDSLELVERTTWKAIKKRRDIIPI